MLATCGLNGVGVEIDCRLDFTPGGEGDLLGLGLTLVVHTYKNIASFQEFSIRGLNVRGR